MLGGTQAAIAIIPVAGFGNDTLDDGVADNDAIPAPSIGSPSAPNVFRGNDSVDIYALDARPANAPSLQSDNRFLGREARYRQDWYGLVRVVDEGLRDVLDQLGCCHRRRSYFEAGRMPAFLNRRATVSDG